MSIKALWGCLHLSSIRHPRSQPKLHHSTQLLPGKSYATKQHVRFLHAWDGKSRSHFLCYHWMWYSIGICRTWQENCTGSLECFKSNRYIRTAGICTKSRVDGTGRAGRANASPKNIKGPCPPKMPIVTLLRHTQRAREHINGR